MSKRSPCKAVIKRYKRKRRWKLCA